MIFLDNGRIVEMGTFDELSRSGGRFTSLLRTSGILTNEEHASSMPVAQA